jgi:MFS-type transporter involved in bile tolerance (Atg22 family)
MQANLSTLGPGFLIVLVIIFALYGVTAWAAIDAMVRPFSVWEGANRSKAGWVILLPITFFFGPIGTVCGIYYLKSVRKELRLPQYLLKR